MESEPWSLPCEQLRCGSDEIPKRAQIEGGEFHDLRRTCLSRWLTNGLTECDVARLDFSMKGVDGHAGKWLT